MTKRLYLPMAAETHPPTELLELLSIILTGRTDLQDMRPPGPESSGCQILRARELGRYSGTSRTLKACTKATAVALVEEALEADSLLQGFPYRASSGGLFPLWHMAA